MNAAVLAGYSALFNISFPLQDTAAMESIPLLGFTIAPEKEEGSSEVGPIFHLYHKKTLFYSFKAEDTKSAQRLVLHFLASLSEGNELLAWLLDSVLQLTCPFRSPWATV